MALPEVSFNFHSFKEYISIPNIRSSFWLVHTSVYHYHAYSRSGGAENCLKKTKDEGEEEEYAVQGYCAN